MSNIALVKDRISMPFTSLTRLPWLIWSAAKRLGLGHGVCWAANITWWRN